ncbi:MAG: OsmC family protein [Granulosicoccaceae bacterium]
MTVRMYAGVKKWPLDDVRVQVSHTREHISDGETCDEKPQQLDIIFRELEIIGDLTNEQRERLTEIADKCPVHKTLTGQLGIRTSVKD